MSYYVLTYQGDLIAFAAIALLATIGIDRWVRRATGGIGFSWRAWVLLAGVVGLGSAAAVVAGDRETARLRQIVSGFAPTYAEELRRLGHERIAPDTPADDPTYLALIDAELRWQRLNPAVADLYTFGRRPDGTVVLLVDAETDYDRNGAFEGDREQRTAIGEVYDKDTDSINRAFAGESVFLDRPTTDRWGTWVSVFVPLPAADGRVAAVFGVDMPADQWITSMLWHRGSMLGCAGLVAAVLVGSLGTTAAMRAEVDKRRATEAALRASEAGLRASEAGLRASETRLRTIVDNEPECVMVVDPAGTLLEINPAGRRALGAGAGTAADLIGRPVLPLVHPDHQARFTEHLRGVCGGEAGTLEFELLGAAGRMWMEAHSVPLHDPAGHVTSVLSVARDVTARKQAEAERERLHRQLLDVSRRAGMAEIATGVLHNVGNALNSVNVSATVIGDRLAAADVTGLAKAAGLIAEHRADLGAYLAADEVGRQLPGYLSLVAQCLDEEHRAVAGELAQLTRGLEHIKEIVRTQQTYAKGSTVVLPVRPADVVDEALHVNRASFERHGIEVVRELADLPPVRLDKHKVIQVLVNLVANAKQATKDAQAAELASGLAAGGHGAVRDRRIVVRAGRSADGLRVRFEVEDDGVGIAPEHLPRLFRHGFTTRPDGHGFGLHSAANAAAEMNGTLTAHSDGPGRGARFTLDLPADHAGDANDLAAAAGTGTIGEGRL